jgi:mRNA-degrading endonuclease toxin of MazEF toxin-antitoxin module
MTQKNIEKQIIPENIQKEFEEWNKKKMNIHCFGKRKFPQQGEIWICDMGKNIESEQNNSRPALVINKPLKEERTCTIIPASNTNRNFSVKIENFNFLPHQIKTVDTRRFKRSIHRISKNNLLKVMEAFQNFQA